MDYDSSSKFISSLAKFLQSLCNGYVEFDNGVEVIGHIYLSVDTGKKIDYILNEKVCKTDENSVTFISNSFHAQPAEKPKPNSKKGKGGDQTETVENVVEIDEGNNDVEPKSTNTGTIPRNLNRNSNASSPGVRKRPFSPHSKPGSSTKRGRNNESSQEHGSFGLLSNEGSGSFSASLNPLRDHPQGSSNLPPSSSQSYDPSYHPSPGISEDIKPTMEPDITFVKEEFGSTQSDGERSKSIDGSFSSIYPNQSYSEGHADQSFSQQNTRLSYGGERPDNGVYDANMMSSQMDEGGPGADPSATGYDNQESWRAYSVPYRHPCSYCSKSFINKSDGVGHMNSHHLNIKPFSCQYCSLSFSYHRSLRRHGLTCTVWHKEQGYDVSGLNRNHQQKTYMSQHHASSTSISSPSFSYPPSTNPSQPYPTHLGSLPVSACPKCGGIYSNAKNLANHIPICNGTNRLMCQFCSRVYSQMCALKEHMRGKHGVGEQLHCKDCGRSFKYKPQLYDHHCPNNPNPRERRLGRSAMPNDNIMSQHLPPPTRYDFSPTPTDGSSSHPNSNERFVDVNIKPEL